jgi:signal transduction histidine kinase
LSAAAPPPARPWRVVILNDADPTLPSFVAIDRAVRTALTAPGRHPVDTFSESLDMLRFPLARIEGEIVALLARKYAAMRIDAVVAIGTASLDFAEKHRDRLWPDARILFQGVPVELLGSRQLSPSTTGLPLQHDLAGVVGLALQLRPETRRVVVISGSGDFDRLMAGVARTQVEPYTDRVRIEYWLEEPVEDLLERVARLGDADAVLYLSVGRDAAGRTFVPRDVAKQLSAASFAPIYGAFETYLGHGIVGGTMYSFETRGRRMGDLVHEALSAPAARIPLVWIARSSCVADANELDRLGMDAGRLPPGCDIRNARPSLWREYRWYILAALFVVLAQTALILALILQRRARRKAEDEALHQRAELAQASRLALAGELTASIAHEINQPLGAILANADAAEALLERGVTDGDELRAIVADIKQADLRASEVIRHVRALVTMHEVEREVVDVNAIVRGVLALLAVEAERRGVAVDAAFAFELPPVLADRVQLQQALVNLCVNAFDAMADAAPKKRRLSVRTAAVAGRRVEIAVGDSGGGIRPDQLPRLFNSFFSTKPHGMGLGLSISRSIVEEHGGTLSAENRDDGALFRIVLPVHVEGEPAPGQVSSQRVAPSQPPLPHATMPKGSS